MKSKRGRCSNAITRWKPFLTVGSIRKWRIWTRYVADLGEKVDSSVEGGIRPVLVLQNDKGNEHSTTVIIAPITSKMTKHRIPTHVLLKNPALERISIIMLEQIQTIDQSQLIEYMGEATVQEMNRIERASRISLGMQGVKRYE